MDGARDVRPRPCKRMVAEVDVAGVTKAQGARIDVSRLVRVRVMHLSSGRCGASGWQGARAAGGGGQGALVRPKRLQLG